MKSISGMRRTPLGWKCKIYCASAEAALSIIVLGGMAAPVRKRCRTPRRVNSSKLPESARQNQNSKLLTALTRLG